MQATVADFRPDGSGSVVLDDGTRLAFDPEAFATSGLRLLRPGQRVRLRVDREERRIIALTIATLPWEEAQPGGR